MRITKILKSKNLLTKYVELEGVLKELDRKGQVIFDLLLNNDVSKRPESAEAAAEILFG